MDELTNSTVFIAAVGGVGIAFGIIEVCMSGFYLSSPLSR